MPGESPLSMMRPPPGPVRKPVGGRSHRRRWIVVAALIVALAVLWVWLWYYAAAVADRTLAGWVEREAAAGRVYSCSAQSIGGFPLSIAAQCPDAGAEIKNTQPPYALKAAAVTFGAQVWHPTRLTGNITGPVTLAELGHPPIWTADWARARLTVRGVPPDPESLSIQLDEPHAGSAGASPNAGVALFKADLVDLQGRVAAGSPRDRPVIELRLQLAKATAPTLHALLASPIDIELDAVIRGFKDLAPKPWADRFREMQAADGGIDIKSLRIAQANAIVVGSGTLVVNGHGKLDGLVRVAVVGIERIVPLLGIDRLIAQGIDQLSGSDRTLERLVPGLSGVIRGSANASVVENLKKMGQPTSIDNQPATVLPLRFADGAVYFGMLRIGEIAPLF
jgi:hypothetical protein